VDGEIMEGDNKYKCSTCDRHVDAVKRACLKDIPDNLIFHLKRFDFNLRTLMRSKINDHFSFPTKIDMRPYKVEHLMDNPAETPEDVFELVGILVHSGTAESGHYYSFIRERPSNADKESWVEFNDDVVSPWDPNQMENACFGGLDYRSSIENTQYDKVWSAYMLFYQRSSVLAAQKNELRLTNTRSPVRLAVPPRLSNHIAMENELLMRKYCLYDSSHATLVSRMLSNLKQINGGRCSASHVLEKHALLCALNTLDQVVARTKDVPDFPPFMMTIRQACNNCAECSRDYLEWFCDCPEALRALLLRNGDVNVRHEIGTSILDALKKVKTEASYAYGLGDDDDSIDELDGGDPRLIQRMIGALAKLWDMFHSSTRAWPEYFGVLSSIASLGQREATLLLDVGYLQKTLEIVSADPLLPLGPQFQRMLTVISKRLSTRPVSYEAVIELLAKLLGACDIGQESIEDDEDRFDLATLGKGVPLTATERHLLMQHWTRSSIHILTEKLLQINQNWEATEAILITLMKWPDPLYCYILQAIVHGIKRGGNSLPAGPFLRAALVYAKYCKRSDSPKAIPQILNSAAKAAGHLDSVDGPDFLDFFKEIYELGGSIEGIDPNDFQRLYVESIKYWAPALLTHFELPVRRGTENFLHELIRLHEETEDPQDRDGVIKRMALGLGIACLEFLHDTYVRPRHQAVRDVLLSINAVIEACCNYCEENDKSREAIRFQELIKSVIPALKKYEVDEADEEVSDWEGSEGEYDGSSEPMDSIAELCAPDEDAAL
jgi:ubiquitin carboxyl-terminal hydrolase 34